MPYLLQDQLAVAGAEVVFLHQYADYFLCQSFAFVAAAVDCGKITGGAYRRGQLYGSYLYNVVAEESAIVDTYFPPVPWRSKVGVGDDVDRFGKRSSEPDPGRGACAGYRMVRKHACDDGGPSEQGVGILLRVGIHIVEFA